MAAASPQRHVQGRIPGCYGQYWWQVVQDDAKKLVVEEHQHDFSLVLDWVALTGQVQWTRGKGTEAPVKETHALYWSEEDTGGIRCDSETNLEFWLQISAPRL
jgi:hypothetical protein